MAEIDQTLKVKDPLTFIIPDNWEQIELEEQGRILLHHLIEASTTIMPGLGCVVGNFTGSGDSAEDCNWSFHRGPSEADEVFFDVNIDSNVAEALTNLAWAMVDGNYPGWENNEGGFGTVTFQLTNRSCILDMYYRVEKEDPQGLTELFNDNPTPEVTLREYTFRTERSVTVMAESEEEANRLVQAELQDGETILSGPEVS